MFRIFMWVCVDIYFFKDRIFGTEVVLNQSAIQRWIWLDQFASPKVLEPISSVYHCRQPQGWLPGFPQVSWDRGARSGDCWGLEFWALGIFPPLLLVVLYWNFCNIRHIRWSIIMVRLFRNKTKCQRIIDAVYACALDLDVRPLPLNMQVGAFHSHKVQLDTVDSRGRPVVTTSSTMEKPPKRNSRWGDLEILPDLQ